MTNKTQYPKAPAMFYKICQPAMDKVWEERRELLEALQTVINLRGTSVTISDKLDTYIREVIAKAEGETR